VREDQEASLRESLGASFDAKAASQYLDQISADRLIQRAVLASEAERVGLQASDDEVKQLVRRAFGTPDGGLDGKSLRDYAVRRFGSEGRFVQEVRDDILFTKLLALIDAGADVSEAERATPCAPGSRRSASPPSRLDIEPPPGVEPDDEAVAKLLREENERVRRYYDEHADRYHLPERVRARHILIRVERMPPRTRSRTRRSASTRRSRASRQGRNSRRSQPNSARTRVRRTAAATWDSSRAGRWCPPSRTSPSSRRTARRVRSCAPTSGST
jgi:hypothetical protein